MRKNAKETKETKKQETMKSALCSLTKENLTQIITDFHIDPRFEPRLPREDDTVLSAPEGFEPVYLQYFLSGLRLPINEFVVEVLRSFKLHLIQLQPNSFNKILGFAMLSRGLGLPISLKLFHYFYTLTYSSDWAIFSLRPDRKECIHGLRDSIKYWKYGFFYISKNSFFEDMAFGKLSAQGF